MRLLSLTLAILLICTSNCCFAQCSSLGDVNQDGVVNLLDVDPFISVLGSGDYQAEADCNEDGVVNLLDVDPFIEILAGGPPTDIQIIRDTIGPDSMLTDGNPGASTAHDGATWFTPGFVINPPENGKLHQISFVMFARDELSQPVSDPVIIAAYSMAFHLWSDGIQGGPDSFFENAIANPAIPGHIGVLVNRPDETFITVEEWGTTGPPTNPDEFTTFLITADLSSFCIQLEGGNEYVVSVIQDADNWILLGGNFRISYSMTKGPEDLFQQYNTTPDLLPGFVCSQHGFGYKQFGVKVTLEVPTK